MSEVSTATFSAVVADLVIWLAAGANADVVATRPDIKRDRTSMVLVYYY